MNMIIRHAENKDQVAWDSYTLNHPDATPYHLWPWRSAVMSAYRHQGYYLLAKEKGAVCGVLPLIHLKRPLLHDQLVSLPFCDLAGPLADDQDVAGQLLHGAAQLARNLNVKSFEIRTRSAAITGADTGSAPQPCKTGKVSMLLDLPANAGELWDGFKSKLRSQVRKAEKNGLVFRFGRDEQDINPFYEVFSRNMQELGSPVHSKEFMTAIFACYGDHCRMGLVFFEERPVGCGLILRCGKTVAIPWASTLREYNRLSPNMLLYWNFLEYAADTGATLFDFGRSTPNEGTYRFKAQWGARPFALHWESRALDGTRQLSLSPSTESRSGNGRQFAVELWKKLPLPIANLLGPTLRRYISL